MGSAAHHVAYMGSREKDELLVDGPAETNRDTLESAAIHAQYAGEREGSLGYFGNMADHPQEAQQSILKAQGPIWRVIASVGEEDAIAMVGGLLTKAGWDQASQPIVAKMITELGLDPAKVQWIAAVHRHQHHENNPHVHLLLWEAGTPSRKTGEWTKKELQAIKREAVSHLYQPERLQLGQEKTALRKQIRETVQTLVTRGNERQGFQQVLTQRLQALGNMLPGKGRLAYAYMPEPVKVQVQDGPTPVPQTNGSLNVPATPRRGVTVLRQPHRTESSDPSARPNSPQKMILKTERVPRPSCPELLCCGK